MLAILMDFQYSNNQAEYKALILGLQLLKDLSAITVNIHGDSLLILSQILGEYKYDHKSLVQYYSLAKTLIRTFSDFSLNFLVKRDNEKANDFAQYTSKFRSK